MVAQLTNAEAWRREGCSEGCSLRMVIVPGLLGRQTIEVHDPDTHEMYGRALAGDVAGAHVLESGPLVLWRRELRLWVDGREIVLTRTEWRILLAIIDGNSRVVSNTEILALCWPGAAAGDEHLLRVHMSRLRARLGTASGLIQTVAGIGYRFHFVTPGEPAPEQRTVYATLIEQGKWAKHHAACLACKTTERPHEANGYCSSCRKRLQRAGRLNKGTGAECEP